MSALEFGGEREFEPCPPGFSARGFISIPNEFLRRILLHVLPKGLVRIRHFGLFANRRRKNALARCRELLGTVACADRPEATNLLHCPVCSGTMLVIERLTSAQLYFRPDLNLSTPR